MRTLFVAAVVGVVGATSPISAMPVNSGPVTDAVVALQAEVMLLVELGAFVPPVPSELVEIQRKWAPYMENLDRPALLGWLLEADGDGAAALEELESADFTLSRAITDALSPIDELDVALLEDGETIGAPARMYARALIDLNALAVLESDLSDTPDPSFTTAAPNDSPSGSTSLGTVPVGVDLRTSPPLRVGGGGLVVAIVGVSALVLVALILMGRLRRRQPSHVEFDRLLEAGRRMTRALDETEIAVIALREATFLARARRAAFVMVEPDAMRLVGDESGTFDDRRLADGVLGRVAETGQPINMVSSDERAVTSLPSALLAVPVIGKGRVVGILFCIRQADRPFQIGEESAVSRLAPMVGSALGAAERHSDMTALTEVDALTGLSNRRKLDADLARALSETAGSVAAGSVGAGSVAVAMIDVDHFKHFNDTNGHAAGDVALASVAAAIGRAIRTVDTAYRYGGEEFTVLLRDIGTAEATAIAERVRTAVRACTIGGEHTRPDGHVTVSIGLAVVSGGDPTSALMVADRALYDAKRRGRDQVVVTDLAEAHPRR